MKKIEDDKDLAQKIVDTVREPMLVLDVDLRVHSANESFYRNFRVEPGETVGRLVYELGNGQWDIAALRELLENVLPHNQFFNDFEVQHEFENLGHRTMLLNARRVNHLQLILLAIEDVTERRRADAALRRSEARLQKMTNIEGVGVLLLRDDGSLIGANETFLKMTGYSRAEIEAGTVTWRDLTPPEYMAISEQQMRKLAETGRIGPYEKEYLGKDGSRLWMLFAGASLDDGTCVEYCLDISDRKRAEAQLKDLLYQKEALLREVNHRVKNNLQAINNLLYIQASTISEEPVRQIIRTAQDRIKAIAMVHELIYRGENLIRLNLAEYLTGLAQQLIYLYRPDPSSLVLKLDVDEVELDVDTAVPMGVIVNELVSNSLKHAFPPGRGQPDEIEIKLRSASEDLFLLTVRDNGVGLPAGIDPKQAPSLGLRLVEMLIGQMRGQLDIERDGGTAFKIRFSRLKSE